MYLRLLIISGLLAAATALAQGQKIPVEFQGRWAGSQQSCPSSGDLRLEILADSFQFHEGRGKVLSVRTLGPLSIELELTMNAEGETWRDTRRFVLSEDKRTLTEVTNANSQRHTARVRCN